MKKLLAIVLTLLVAFSCFAMQAGAADAAPTYYIDSLNGDDANDGLSPETAWKTIQHDNYVFVPGTQVLLRRGGAYECTNVYMSVDGTKENPIVISSYGEGDRPLLYAVGANLVFHFVDCSYITVSDVQITAPDGGGIWINTVSEVSEGITIDNVKFFGIQNYEVGWRDNLSAGPVAARACIVIKGLPSGSIYPVNDVTISNCEMTDCANGISAWGMCKGDPGTMAEIDPVFNTGLLIENCYFADMDAEAIIVGLQDGAVVRNCVSTRCCLGADEPNEDGSVKYFTAAIWFWGSVNSVIEHCEISDQKNYGDGMTVDFDSFTNYCTYQYVYSHDNVRFMVNNAKFAPQKGNTVRYCLSVNDGIGSSRLASGAGEENLSFYNNTIVNCGLFDFSKMSNSLVVNNIIIPRYGYKLYCDTEDAFGKGNTISNNCYYNGFNPICEPFAMNTLPGFAGTDYTDADSFRLAKNSRLIGAGVEVEDDLTVDFYGEPIVSNNIGCYGGEGVDTEGEVSNLFKDLINWFKVIVKSIEKDINDFIEDMKYNNA